MVNKFDKYRVLFFRLSKILEAFAYQSSVDALLCFITVIIAFFLRLGSFGPINYPILLAAALSVAFAIPLFFLSGLYRTIFRYSGWPAMLAVSKSIFLYSFFYSFIICNNKF